MTHTFSRQSPLHRGPTIDIDRISVAHQAITHSPSSSSLQPPFEGFSPGPSSAVHTSFDPLVTLPRLVRSSSFDANNSKSDEKDDQVLFRGTDRFTKLNGRALNGLQRTKRRHQVAQSESNIVIKPLAFTSSPFTPRSMSPHIPSTPCQHARLSLTSVSTFSSESAEPDVFSPANVSSPASSYYSFADEVGGQDLDNDVGHELGPSLLSASGQKVQDRFQHYRNLIQNFESTVEKAASLAQEAIRLGNERELSEVISMTEQALQDSTPTRGVGAVTYDDEYSSPDTSAGPSGMWEAQRQLFCHPESSDRLRTAIPSGASAIQPVRNQVHFCRRADSAAGFNGPRTEKPRIPAALSNARSAAIRLVNETDSGDTVVADNFSPLALQWRRQHRNMCALAACVNTALVGLIVGVYSGEVPSLQFHFVDHPHTALLGNTSFYCGLALSTLLLWPLPFRYARKPLVLLAITSTLPCLYIQAVIVSTQWISSGGQAAIATLKAVMGLSLGLANVNQFPTILDLCGSSLASPRSHEEHIAHRNDRRIWSGAAYWLGVWTLCFFVFIPIGFLSGASLGSLGLQTGFDWAFCFLVGLCASVLVINIVLRDTRERLRTSLLPAHSREMASRLPVIRL